MAVELEEVQPIQGRLPASKEEYWLSKALSKLGHQYIYQYQLGVRGVRGAYKIDWLVLTTVPLSTPLEFFGEYWHQGQMGSQDRYRIAQIDAYFRGRANPLEIIWGEQVGSEDEAIEAAREVVGVA